MCVHVCVCVCVDLSVFVCVSLWSLIYHPVRLCHSSACPYQTLPVPPTHHCLIPRPVIATLFIINTFCYQTPLDLSITPRSSPNRPPAIPETHSLALSLTNTVTHHPPIRRLKQQQWQQR